MTLTGGTLAAVLVALGLPGIVTLILNHWFGRQHRRVDAATTIVTVSTALIDRLAARIDALETEVMECHRDRDADRARLRSLEIHIMRLQGAPWPSFEQSADDSPTNPPSSTPL